MVSEPTKQEISTALGHLSAPLLKEALLRAGEQASDKNLVGQALNLICQLGVEEFVDEVADYSREKLLALYKFEGLSDNEKENSERLQQLAVAIHEKGIDSLVLSLDVPLLEQFSAELGLLRGKPKQELQESLADEILLMGMKSFLSLLVVGTLRKMCREYDINKEGGKEQLVDSLMVHVFELHPAKDFDDDASGKGAPSTPKKGGKKDEVDVKKKGEAAGAAAGAVRGGKKEEPKSNGGARRGKKSFSEDSEEDDDDDDDASVGGVDLSGIKKGINFVQMYDTYNASDLVTYCRNNNLKCSGKKSQLIKRILQFLETGDIDVGRKGSSKRKSLEVKPGGGGGGSKKPKTEASSDD